MAQRFTLGNLAFDDEAALVGLWVVLSMQTGFDAKIRAMSKTVRRHLARFGRSILAVCDDQHGVIAEAF